MSHTTSTDNIYKTGLTIYAKAAPQLKLIIMKYYQRIYYCAIADDLNHKQLAYFEHELIPPATLTQ